MKAHDLRELSIAELESRIKDENKALEGIHFKKAVTGQIDNTAALRTHRRELARLKTVISEKASS